QPITASTSRRTGGSSDLEPPSCHRARNRKCLETGISSATGRTGKRQGESHPGRRSFRAHPSHRRSMKPYAFHPDAEREYTAAAQYYARISPELAGRLYDEMERLISDIRNQPDRLRIFVSPVRRHFSDVFPYAILYVDQPARVWVIA